jgi:hypothetical protein
MNNHSSIDLRRRRKWGHKKNQINASPVFFFFFWFVVVAATVVLQINLSSRWKHALGMALPITNE